MPEDLFTAPPPKIETVVMRPPSPKSAMVVKVLGANGELKVYSDYDPAIVEICKSFNFRWQPPFWARCITKYDGGDLIERMVEIAYALLSAGFIVETRAALQSRIENADYEDERTRWIMIRTKDPYQGRFAIYWKRGEDFYGLAKKLPGAQYSKPSVVVKCEYFEEVIDFAEMYDFHFSDGALEAIDAAKRKKAEAIRVELKPRPPKHAPVVEDKTDEARIDDELRDDFDE